jgi:hypothetical protein
MIYTDSLRNVFPELCHRYEAVCLMRTLQLTSRPSVRRANKRAFLQLRPSFRTADQNWSGRRGSNSQLSAWEAGFSILYFQHLHNRPEKMHVHALHTVHVVHDLRVAAGRLRDGVSSFRVHAVFRFRANSFVALAYRDSKKISDAISRDDLFRDQ